MGGGWRAGTPSTAFAAAAPASRLPGRKPGRMAQNDWGPLMSGPRNSSEAGRARSTRDTGGHQTLAAPRPIGIRLELT